MDKASVIGLIVGFGGIILGNALEGGHIDSLLQFTAAVIVLAGTIGAVMVSHRGEDLKKGFDLLKQAFAQDDKDEAHKTINEIVECSRMIKKESLVAIEPQLGRFTNPFFKKILRSLIDGLDVETVREIYELEIDCEEDSHLAGAKVWTDAGGYSPTIGIIGAVLGLIHVMGNLSDTSKLGGGIAVAFVATVYGVSFANLLFLPLGSKIKRKVQQESNVKKLILEGALMVNSGLSSAVIDQKLRARLASS